MLSATTFSNKFVKLIQLVKRIIVSYDSLSVALLMIHETKSTVGKHSVKSTLKLREEVNEEGVMLPTLVKSALMYLTVAQQVVLNSVCRTPALVTTPVACLLKILPHISGAEINASMIVKGKTDMYIGLSFFVNNEHFGNIGVRRLKHRKGGVVENEPLK